MLQVRCQDNKEGNHHSTTLTSSSCGCQTVFLGHHGLRSLDLLGEKISEDQAVSDTLVVWKQALKIPFASEAWGMQSAAEPSRHSPLVLQARWCEIAIRRGRESQARR